MTRCKTVAILYHSRGSYPLRSAVESHLYAWQRYSRNHTAYVNAAMCDPVESLRAIQPDAIIVHTSFCGVRWNQAEYTRLEPTLELIGRIPALKIAFPQDEYYLVKRLHVILEKLRVDVVLSCAEPANWSTLYGPLCDRIQFRTVLTGYLDDRIVKKAKKYNLPVRKRDIFLSYRAWDTGFWLGEHGTYKVRVGEAMRAALEHRDLPSDISMTAADTITGEKWLKFLGNSRATVGVEGGASLIDPDGAIKACVDDYVAANPDAKLEDVRRACFLEDNEDFKLACLSPRHLEAVATGTVQALVRGRYNGILEADRHYVPIEEDFSNLDAVIDVLKDDEAVSTIVERAYQEIVESGLYTYRSLVAEIDTAWIDPLPVASHSPSAIARMASNFKDWLNWRIIQAECFYLDNPRLFRPFAWLLRPIYCRLVPNKSS